MPYARPTSRKPLQNVNNAIVMAMVPARQRREARSLERLPIHGMNIHALNGGRSAL
jgi:hypothetical protein